MKSLHFLTKQIAYMAMFLKSPSGAFATLFVVFLFDVATMALGVQTFFSERLAHTLAGLGLAKIVIVGISLAFSFFAAAALGLSIVQATLNNKKFYSAGLSLLSFLMSAAGLAHVGLNDVQTAGELIMFNNAVRLMMVLSLAILPPAVYSMNAELVSEKFGALLDSFIAKSTAELETSFDAQVKDLGTLDAKRTKAEVAKKSRKFERTAPRAAAPKAEDKGALSIDEFMKTLN